MHTVNIGEDVTKKVDALREGQQRSRSEMVRILCTEGMEYRKVIPASIFAESIKSGKSVPEIVGALLAKHCE